MPKQPLLPINQDLFSNSKPLLNTISQLESNSNSTISNSSNSFQSSNPYIINYVGTSSSDISSKTIINTKITALNDDVIYSDFDTQIPLFAINRKLIKVPRKIPYALDRFTPKHLLKAIHPNMEVAKEMCLLFVRQLNSTYFDLLHDENNKGWKSLKAEYLRELFSFDSMAYKHIIEALVYPLKKRGYIRM